MKQWTPKEIKDFRQRLQLYQKDFAALLRVTEQYVCYLERGLKTPSNPLRALLDCLEKEKGKESEKRHGKRHL